MLSASDTLYMAVNFQLLLTLLLVGLLWAFYYRLQRFEFFRWWAWAWTALALFLGSATLSLRLGPTWTPAKFFFVSCLVLAGFFQPLLLMCGGLSWRSPERSSRRFFWIGSALVVTMAALCFFLGFVYRASPAISFGV